MIEATTALRAKQGVADAVDAKVENEVGAAGSALSSVDKALAVLEAFDGLGSILGVTEIAKRAKLPKSTAHRMLTVLASRGYVERHGNRYAVGVRLFELGNLVSHCQMRGLRSNALPFMLDLVRATEVTAMLGVLSGEDVLVLETLPGRTGANVSVAAGKRLPLRYSALGRAILAFSPVDRTCESDDRRAPTSADAQELGKYGLADRGLTKVRETGLAYDGSQLSSGVISIAAPILEPRTGDAIGAIAASCVKVDINRPQIERELLRTADAIARYSSIRISAIA